MNWGPFTCDQEPAVEAELVELCEQVRDRVLSTVPTRDLRALALIGGYGRGEGGVEATEQGPRPHNNLDFVLIVSRRSKRLAEQWKESLDAALACVRNDASIGIDLSVVHESKLLRSPCLVMWYDMRNGHKTIAGDAKFLPGLKQFRVERIMARDVRDLLVNRGSLLVINRWLARNANQWEDAVEGKHGGGGIAAQTERDDAPEALSALQRTLVRHLHKAIIGYGDALLYFAGQYHWSYVEKAERMAACELADPDFTQLYLDATAFRMAPCYDEWRERDVLEEQRRLLPLLSHVHLCCESLRLQRTINDWDEYAQAAPPAALAERWQDPVEWLRKGARLARDAQTELPGYGLSALGVRAAGERGRLAFALPATVYDVESLRPWAWALLQGQAKLPYVVAQDDLEDLYVTTWGDVADSNFRHVRAQFMNPDDTDSSRGNNVASTASTVNSTSDDSRAPLCEEVAR